MFVRGQLIQTGVFEFWVVVVVDIVDAEDFEAVV
jgi:hypothetical protein